MKLTRILAGFLALLMLVGSLAACGETTDDPAHSDDATTAPVETEPEVTDPVAPTPTGDSALIFAVIAAISVIGVAVVAKKREN